MKLLRNSVATLCYSLLLTAAPVFAVEYALPAANSRLVGENLEYVVPAEENGQPLEAIAAKFQLGLTNMTEANPDCGSPAGTDRREAGDPPATDPAGCTP